MNVSTLDSFGNTTVKQKIDVNTSIGAIILMKRRPLVPYTFSHTTIPINNSTTNAAEKPDILKAGYSFIEIIFACPKPYLNCIGF